MGLNGRAARHRSDAQCVATADSIEWNGEMSMTVHGLWMPFRAHRPVEIARWMIVAAVLSPAASSRRGPRRSGPTRSPSGERTPHPAQPSRAPAAIGGQRAMQPIRQRPAALPADTGRATVSPISRLRLAACATEHLWMNLNGRALRHSAGRRAAPPEGVVPRLDFAEASGTGPGGGAGAERAGRGSGRSSVEGGARAPGPSGSRANLAKPARLVLRARPPHS